MLKKENCFNNQLLYIDV